MYPSNRSRYRLGSACFLLGFQATGSRTNNQSDMMKLVTPFFFLDSSVNDLRFERFQILPYKMIRWVEVSVKMFFFPFPYEISAKQVMITIIDFNRSKIQRNERTAAPVTAFEQFSSVTANSVRFGVVDKSESYHVFFYVKDKCVWLQRGKVGSVEDRLTTTCDFTFHFHSKAALLIDAYAMRRFPWLVSDVWRVFTVLSITCFDCSAVAKVK